MREILFRGLTTEVVSPQRWIYGCYNYGTFSGERFSHSIQELDGASYLIIPETLGQYIGIKDQKRVNIFEGDKVQFIHYDKIFKREVKFNDEIIGFDPFCTPIDYDEIYLRRDNLLIIGNIHTDK